MDQVTRCLLIALLFVVGCSPKRSEVNLAQADAAAAIAWVAAVEAQSTPAPKPTPKPDGEDCENCDGTGKVGDGVIEKTCQVCGGTGKKKRAMEAFAPKTTLAVLEVFTGDDPVSKAFMAVESKLFESNAIEVIEKPALDKRPTPYFVLTKGKLHWEFKELTWESFDLWWKQQKDKDIDP
jgi:hypothetical protein